ncbi:CaiB/BaiF CoA transferase family protein [Pseudonocardia oroxyli]|uniref:Alpha-methylacyl-CoA racemase n=1 Tax=Pseudonocardia oroxyli TaxID=366584 RepID=A0A1G7THR2_PSEOR|nr:CaiB/BaiF CoA-transferase family protein [Pseudonocardia oroxyli]SDG34907.1 alpha-methylacyl-CoA racemase [Pseudonocardia oroxyli]
MSATRSGPLTGVRVLEMAALGPVPFAAMMLADLGADVVLVDRTRDARASDDPALDVTKRGRRSIGLDLKDPRGREVLLDLVRSADVLLEGNRPGVMERLGLGPDECLAARPQLVYGRATGWGQEGPWAQDAAHDINFMAVSGVLHAIGRPGERPVPPLNMLGDYGGGGMLLAFGVVSAVLEARTSGRGQVVDAAILDGLAAMSALELAMQARGLQSEERGANLLDTGAPFYDVYECADGRYLSVGAIEPKFYARLCELTGFEQDLPAEEVRPQLDKTSWPDRKRAWEKLFASRSRADWCALLEHEDACVAPVLSWREAFEHPHNVARSTFVSPGGVPQGAPAPRFSRTPGAISRPACAPGEHTTEILEELGKDSESIAELQRLGIVGGRA